MPRDRTCSSVIDRLIKTTAALTITAALIALPACEQRGTQPQSPEQQQQQGQQQEDQQQPGDTTTPEQPGMPQDQQQPGDTGQTDQTQ